MKTLVITLALFLTAALTYRGYAQQPCCPNFDIKITNDVCDTVRDQPAGSIPPNGQEQRPPSLCQNGTYNFVATPNLPGFTYTWFVTGGVATPTVGNPVSITWGTGTTGTIMLMITSTTDPFCIRFVVKTVNLRPGPKAQFSVSSHTVCANTSVTFTNTSIGGSSYLWNFGDNTTSTSSGLPPGPPVIHSYTTPGTYIVTLTVSTPGGRDSTTGKTGCPCTSVFQDTIIVTSGTSVSITDQGCKKMLCPGDSVRYCASPGTCTSYTWTVVSGTILAQSGNCVDIRWTPTSGGPQPSVTVTVPASCVPGCSNTATLIVPVLYNGIPIAGNAMVCVGSTQSYSLPTLPGTFMRWKLSGGGTFMTADSNNEAVSINWTSPGTYTVSCTYSNPLTGCSGQTSLTVVVKPVFKITGPTNSCETCTSTYATADGSTASWTIMDQSAVIVYSNPSASTINYTWPNPGASPQMYTVTATPSSPTNYCNPSASIGVLVSPLPIISAITGPSMICPGSTEMFFVTSWKPGTPIEWIVLPSGSGTVVTTGTDNDSAQITFTGSGPFTVQARQRCQSNTCTVYGLSPVKNVTVVPPPPAITGNSPVCMDAVESYSISGVAGVNYQWTLNPASGGTILSGQGGTTISVQWHGPATTSQQIQVTNCAGSSPIKTIQITAPPTISVTASGSFCTPPNTITLTASPTGTYNWYSSGGGFISTGSTCTISTPGDYYAEVTGTGSCPARGYIHIPPVICTATGGVGTGSGGDCMIAQFLIDKQCGVVKPIDISLYAPGCSYSVVWSAPGATPATSTSPAPTFTYTTSGTYSITLTATCGTCTRTATVPFTVTVPTASFTMSPSPACVGQPVTFSSGAPSGTTCSWNFGDGQTSNLCTTTHAYATDGTFTVTLNTTDGAGCSATVTQTIVVNKLPSCTVSPSPLAICPGDTATLTATPSPAGSYTYQWYNNGTALPGQTNQTLGVYAFGHYHVVATNTSTGCSIASNVVLVTLKQAPIAKIVGSSTLCYPPANPVGASVTLNNSFNGPGYIYSWSSGPGITITPTNTYMVSAALNTPTPAPFYQIYLKVTDPATGCSSYDTMCLYPSKEPAGFISGGGGCEGVNSTLTATITAGTGPYMYSWNTGATTPSITTSVAGVYSVVVTSTANGCSTVLTTMIKPKPDVSLFPLGCDTLCTKDTIKVPLPINPPPSYGSYTVKWYDGATLIYTGWQLPIMSASPPLSLGPHSLHIEVEWNPTNGCQSISGIFNAFIKNCDSCNCKGHELIHPQYSIGHNGMYQSFPINPIPIPLGCQPITVTANFNCDSNCPKTVSAVLIGPGGAILQTVNTMPATFTPAPGWTPGVYTIMLYGKCGDVICDSAMIKVNINCPVEEKCKICPPEFEKAITINLTPQPLNQVSIGGTIFNHLGISANISAGTTMLTQVGAQIISYELDPGYKDCITCDNKPAGWVSIAGGTLGGLPGVNVGAQMDNLPPNNKYMNPKEVVWQSTTPFTLNPGSTMLDVYLPSLAQVPCCNLKGKICIRFTFRDTNCKVCEKVVCFEFGKGKTVETGK